MARIPRWAEKDFSAKCSLEDAVTTRPDEDINGWDFLVEFLDRTPASPSENTPARRQAFVQIKSTTGKSTRTTVKLSNMLKACGSYDPWFIFLFREDGAIFGVEVIDELLSRALKEIRKARLARKPLHKTYLSLDFDTGGQVTGGIVGWMEDRIASSSQAYMAKKKEQFEKKGYEDGFGSGKITITANSHDDLKANLLGLGEGLLVQRLAFAETRFGITEPLRELGNSGLLFIKPNPIDTCEIRLRGSATEPPLLLQGTVYGIKPPMVFPSDLTLRFSSPPLEIVQSAKAGRGLLRVDHTERAPLQRFIVHAKLLRWMNSGPIQIEIRRRGKPAYRSSFRSDQPGDSPSAFEDIVFAVEKIAAQTDLSSLNFSIADLNEALPDLHEASLLLTDRNIRIEATATAFDQRPPDVVMYLVSAELASWTLACVVERPITEDEVKGELRSLTMGAPTIREAYAIEGATSEEIAALAQELARISGETDLMYNVLVIPEMMERLAESRTGQ